MALYVVSYDIADKDKFEYEPLWAKLKAMKATKILYSEWLIVADTGQAAKLYDSIAPLTSSSDRLLVQEVTKDATWDKLLITDDEFRKLLQKARG